MRIALAALAAALVAGPGGSVMADASASSTSGQITELSWSPDGKWLAYLVDTDPGPIHAQILRVVRVDRVVQRDVATVSPPNSLWIGESAAWIKWAPDSKQFAVREYDYSTNRDIALISSANGRRLHRFEGRFADWSPGSREFLLQKGSSVYIVDSTTRGERFLVQGFRALWSPSGARIAFSATTQHTACGNDIRLFSVDTSGAGRLQLGTDRFSFSAQVAAAWAPDSSRIAYYEGHSLARCFANHGLVIVPADGSKQAVELGGRDSPAMSWSPTGVRLAIFAGGDLRILTPQGATQAAIPSLREYGWAPNGARVVFRSRSTRPADIYVSRIDRSALRVIAEAGEHPAWSKLGWIAYSNLGSCKAGGDRVFVVRPNGTHRHALSRCRATR
jgi:Tol biopolymer transport system component